MSPRLRHHPALGAWALGVLCWLLAQSANADTESRLALLIGNSAYKSAPLPNPVNDVRLMEEVLKQVGFTVIKAENASIREMRRLVRDFGDRLKASGGVGLFYFAGHGVQVRGENFLVSTDSDIRNEDEVADDAVNANVVLEKMQSAGNRLNLIILDACRNNPFAVKSRNAAAGLAILNAPSGSLVAYATAPGSVASDGSGSNGLYTQHLAKAILQHGLTVEEVFKQVRAGVRQESNNQQTPWENTALEGQFFFRVPVAAAAASVPSAAVAAVARPIGSDQVALELAMWDSVKNSQRSAELQAYLSQFPTGTFAALARARIEEIGINAPQPVSAARPTAVSPPMPIDGKLGILEMTDILTKLKTRLDVVVQPSEADRTAYSTGDVIGKDGKVLQVRVGDVVLKVVSGSLWTVPIKVGDSGAAAIDPVGLDLRSRSGTLRWKVIAASDGKLQIEADVAYSVTGAGGQRYFERSGKWLAKFSGASALPEFSTATIRSSDPNTGSLNVSSELKLR